ncbi:putative transcription factor C3H family [Rosa chinensis]|uniref:Putative transcription factor C3H family n=1 Tax=Rosa chinensis TaxID=74649 RepID=A0A2P6QFU8_ROSCH|nr:zinc finger CCCH domain-containing protein 46 isoform X2 [Rosa chinensis]PRQ33056.1 putative transcription factor C3H family [Rosa chinensis]
MDSYEATRIVFSRIQSLDSENASKIMGYLLIQDQGEKEMIRLAFGPETLLHNLIINAKTHLGLVHSKTPSFNPISRPNSLPLSSSPTSNLWSLSNPISPSSTCSPTYANVVSKNTNLASGSLSPSINDSSSATELVDNFQFSFLNDPKTDEEFFDGGPEGVYGNSSMNKQSYSAHCGCAFGSEDVNSGLGWKPCSYFARGFCKNGSSCRFLHSDGLPGNVSMLEQCEDLLRSNAAAQQHKLATVSQFMSNGSSLPYNRCLNFLMQQQNDTQRSLMMGEELLKFGRYQHERNDISSLGGNVIPSSRQIYLTFPADSTFREEDVSNYFNMFGPVQDVRIPYQQKRMFGFVTFVYSETVRIILAKGNPHFVCDSRVLVKPYKEKGKIPDRKLHQHLERGDYSLCSSLSGLDSREPYDFNLGSRMYYSTQEMLLRRKLEDQANLEQAIELQERRLTNMQLLGIKNNNHHQYYQGLSEGSPFPSPTFSHAAKNQSLTDVSEVISQSYALDGEQQEEEKSGKDQSNAEECDLHQSVEHILPDNLFASPAVVAGDHINVFSTASAPFNESTSAISSSSNSNSNNLLPTASTSTSNATSPKSVLSSSGFLLGMEPLECN